MKTSTYKKSKNKSDLQLIWNFSDKIIDYNSVQSAYKQLQLFTFFVLL